MATYKHLKYDGKEILAGAAYRDSNGKNIANTYATNTSVDSKIQQATGGLSPVATSGDYADLSNQPKINNVELSGSKSLSDLGIATKTSELTNDSGFVTKDADNLTNYTKTTDINTALAKKVEGSIEGTKGTAKIFNESDGGGAQFVGTGTYTGVVAYVGTHDNIGGEIGTQIYVDKPNGTESTIIDVTQNGAYYNKGTIQGGAARDVEAKEIAVKGDIPTKVSDLTNDSNFVDKHVEDLTYYTKSTDLAAVATSGKYSDLSDKPTIPTKVSDLNNDTGFVTKAVSDLTNYYDKTYIDSNIDDKIESVAATIPTKVSQLTNDSGFITSHQDISGKVDKEVAGTGGGTARIFNESDGGGAKFEYNDSVGSEAFVGVNCSATGASDMMAQIYADEWDSTNSRWVGSRINVYKDKIYYQNKAKTTLGIAKNNANLEIATLGDLVTPESITTDIAVGHLASGTTIAAGTSLFNILKQILVSGEPTGTCYFYWGSSSTIPTGVEGLNKMEVTKEQLLTEGFSITKDIEAPENYYTVFALTSDLGVIQKKVSLEGAGEIDNIASSTIGSNYIFYITEPAGSTETYTYIITFKEA